MNGAPNQKTSTRSQNKMVLVEREKARTGKARIAKVNPDESYDPLLMSPVKSTSISVDDGEETG